MHKYRLELRIILISLVVALIIVIVEFLSVNHWGLPVKQTHIETLPTSNTSQQNDSSQQAVINQQELPMEVTTPQMVNTKIVTLGDSFTFGYPAGQDYSWTKRLEKVLNQPVVNKGKVGQTTQDLLRRFDKDVIQEKPGRVIIFAGTGDALRGGSLQKYQVNIQALVAEARFNKITPILALPLPYPGTQEKIKAMRAWELGFAQTEKLVLLNFDSVLFDANGKFLSNLSGDRTYPSVKGYEVMGDYAASVLSNSFVFQD
ncbi:MAG: GDSL-type esterase/lipase family protein [Desulfitobacteriaceae bacterium]